jgi:hypothetical protein
LRKQLAHEHITNDTPLDPYFEILSRLMDAMQRGDTGNAVQGDWDVALSATAELRAFAGDIHRPSYEIIFQADVERAHAAIRLRGIQTDDQIDRTPYDLSPKRDALIARSIGKRVSRMSGIELAARLFQYLDKTYCEEHGCYHNVNRFAPPGRQSFAPRLPSHFLLQLAAKYPTGKRPYKKHCR